MFSQNYCTTRADLIKEGWRTPNTYGGHEYQEPGEFSAVYLFLAVDVVDTETCEPLYVGMSQNIVARWRAHPTLREVQQQFRYVQKWFLPVEIAELRHVERQQIQRFNPPWNIIGKRRGML